MPLDTSDRVRHVAGGDAKFTVKTCGSITGFTNDTPFGKAIPLYAGIGSQAQPNTAWEQIIGCDVRELFTT